VKYYQVRCRTAARTADDEVLHVPGLSYDGLRGMSVIGKMRDALGLAKAAENLAGSSSPTARSPAASSRCRAR
jgi:hypothetical protein